MTKRPTLRDKAQAIQAFSPFEGGKTCAPPWVGLALAAKERIPAERKKEEDTFHVALVKELRKLPATILWHTPSTFFIMGEDKGPFFHWIGKLKAKGWFGGIPDLVLIFRSINGATTVVFMELKAPKKDLAENQADFCDKANAVGCFTARVRTMDEAWALLRLAGHPLGGVPSVPPA